MVQFQIVVKDSAGVKLGEFDTYRNLSFGKRLNDYGTCEFEILVTDPKAISLVALRQYTVEIYRLEGGDTTLVWAGEQALRKGSLKVDRNNWCTIVCFTWFEQLKKRYTDALVVYEAEDQGQIAVDLIDGAFDITTGDVPATVDRDRTYYNQNVYEAIINLANVLSGFDFEITDAKVFNVYEVQGVDRTDSVILEYGHNMTEAEVIEDFTNPINRAIVLGEMEGEDELQRVERNDAGSQSLYGLREETATDNDISELATFQEKGDSILRKYAGPLMRIENAILKSSISITSFALGDEIGLKINSGMYDIDESYRVFEWTVTVGVDNTESLTLVLSNFTL